MEYKDMESVLNGLVAGLKKDNTEKAKSILSVEQVNMVAKAINSGDLDEIDCIVFSGFRYMMEDLCNVLGLSAEGLFLVEHYGFVERSFKKMYESYEGSACCADKSRTVARRLFTFFVTGKNIDFNEDAEYTYHHPKKILKDHESIVAFFAALRNLYYGSPVQYLKAVQNIAAEA